MRLTCNCLNVSLQLMGPPKAFTPSAETNTEFLLSEPGLETVEVGDLGMGVQTKVEDLFYHRHVGNGWKIWCCFNCGMDCYATQDSNPMRVYTNLDMKRQHSGSGVDDPSFSQAYHIIISDTADTYSVPLHSVDSDKLASLKKLQKNVDEVLNKDRLRMEAKIEELRKRLEEEHNSFAESLMDERQTLWQKICRLYDAAVAEQSLPEPSVCSSSLTGCSQSKSGIPNTEHKKAPLYPLKKLPNVAPVINMTPAVEVFSQVLQAPQPPVATSVSSGSGLGTPASGSKSSGGSALAAPSIKFVAPAPPVSATSTTEEDLGFSVAGAKEKKKPSVKISEDNDRRLSEDTAQTPKSDDDDVHVMLYERKTELDTTEIPTIREEEDDNDEVVSEEEEEGSKEKGGSADEDDGGSGTGEGGAQEQMYSCSVPISIPNSLSSWSRLAAMERSSTPDPQQDGTPERRESCGTPPYQSLKRNTLKGAEEIPVMAQEEPGLEAFSYRRKKFGAMI